jgi:hypothetical protein
MLKKHLLSASILLLLSTGIQAKGDTSIPYLPPIGIKAGEELDIQYALVNNHKEFVVPLSVLAHNLGYAWVAGNHGKHVGEDMTVQQMGDAWVIQGNNDGDCDGYRCGEKTKITIDNFKYTLNPGEFKHGEVLETEQEVIKTISAVATNKTSVKQTVEVVLHAEEVTTWSKEGEYGLTEFVQTQNKFKWPLVGTTGFAVTISPDQSWKDTNGGQMKKDVKYKGVATIPPHSTVPVRLELFRSSISYPYSIGVNISYDATFEGFLRWSGNAWHTHPEDRPHRKHTFTIGRKSDESGESTFFARNIGESADIRYQWDHRNSLAGEKWWDWNWSIHEYGMDNMRYWTGHVLRPFHTYIEGTFKADSQFSGDVEFGKPVKLKANARSSSISEAQINAASYTPSDGVHITSDIDADELDSLGLSNAELTIRTVEE